MNNFLVISAIGADRPGIVNSLSMSVMDNGCTIADSRMTVLGGEFAVILMVAGNWNNIAKLEDALKSIESKLQLTITAKHTEARAPQASMMPYMVEVIAMDHPGIVYNVAEFFSSRKINIEELTTGNYAAAHSGTTMFSMNMVISIPADIQLAELREQFAEFSDNLNLDAVMEPLKG